MKIDKFRYKSELEKLLESLARQDVRFVKSLVKNGIDVNMKTKFGASPLHLAAYELDLASTEFFLSREADINSKDDNDRTVLHYVNLNFQDSDTDAVAELLISRGADVNARDKDGNTPLHFAAKRGAISLAKFYLKHKAEVNCKNLRDVIPLVNAIEIGSIVMVELLISHGADVNNLANTIERVPVNLACDKKYFRIANCLLTHGANGNILDYYGKLPLQKAIQSKRPKLVDLLLKHNVDVNAKNSDNETAIAHAIIFEDHDLVWRLINRGADVNNIDKTDERTLLNRASSRRMFEMVECLLENGADPDEQEEIGFTPLMNVVRFGSRFKEQEKLTVEVLLLYGADVNILFPSGINTLKFYRHDKRCYDLILQHVAKLKELDLPVQSAIIDDISSNRNFSNYYDACRQELTKARVMKLRDCWVTFFNLLTDDLRSLVKYAGNQDLVEDFNDTNLTDKFPIHGDTMIKRFSKGIHVRKLWNLAASNLSAALLILNPTHLIIRDILDCLMEKDLFVLSY